MPSQRGSSPSGAPKRLSEATVDYTLVETPAVTFILALARHQAWLDHEKTTDQSKSIVPESIDSKLFDR
jgi:hypothetical protein